MFEKMFNFKKFSEKLYSAGMPTKEQLEEAISYNINIVINLAPHTAQNALANEEHIVKNLNIDYVNIPVDWNSPTKDNLITFMDIMDNNQDKTILVHCQANFRASSFISMYRIIRHGWEREQAIKVMHEIWNDEVYPIWNEFIEEILNDFGK